MTVNWTTFLKRVSAFVFVVACCLTSSVYSEDLSPFSLDSEKFAVGASGREPGSSRIDPHGTENLKKLNRTEIPVSKVGPVARPVPNDISEVSVGTAWPIAAGYVVTNNHVVTDSKEVVLINTSGREIPAWTVLRDEVYDIALLQVDDFHLLPPALPLADGEVGPGTEVFTVGYPRIDVLGRTPKLSDGVISRMDGPAGNPVSYQTTVSIQPGNSGGPLLNMSGEVVGVVRSMLGILNEREGKVLALHNASCAVKIDLVKELLGYLPHQETALEALPRRSECLEKLATRIQGSILIVEAR